MRIVPREFQPGRCFSLHLLTAVYRYSSFIESHAQPLLDLSLYVSSENYNEVTRPAYASILQWPNQWIIPPRIRSAAKTRAEHLGLSSIDLDVAEEKREEKEKQEGRQLPTATSQIPRSLMKKPRDTVSGLLSKTAQQNRIRLEGITEDFAVPLEEMLEKRQVGGGYLLSDDLPSSVDCLALGYLALAIKPEVPFSWLRECIGDKAPQLAAYVERLSAQCFPGEDVDVETALSGQGGGTLLPWQARGQIGLVGIGLRAFEGVLDSIPVVGEIRASRRLQKFGRDVTEETDQEVVLQVAEVRRREAYISAAMVLGGIGMLAGYLLSSGLVRVSIQEGGASEEDDEDERQEKQSHGAYGEAGAILGVLPTGD